MATITLVNVDTGEELENVDLGNALDLLRDGLIDAFDPKNPTAERKRQRFQTKASVESARENSSHSNNSVGSETKTKKEFPVMKQAAKAEPAKPADKAPQTKSGKIPIK